MGDGDGRTCQMIAELVTSKVLHFTAFGIREDEGGGWVYLFEAHHCETVHVGCKLVGNSLSKRMLFHRTLGIQHCVLRSYPQLVALLI